MRSQAAVRSRIQVYIVSGKVTDADSTENNRTLLDLIRQKVSVRWKCWLRETENVVNDS